MQGMKERKMDALKGKVVLVTGAGRGLGRELAVAFADQGAIVAANDLTPVNLDVTLKLIHERGGKVKDYLFDVAIRMQAQAMLDEIVDDLGRLDIVVNHATVRPRASILDMDEWDWRRTIDVNLSGPFFLIQAAGKIMERQGGGVVVNIGEADVNLDGLTEHAAYHASKIGLAGLTRQAGNELGKKNINVHLVCPGDPPGSVEILLNKDSEHPWSVVERVLFLCSQGSLT